jgi:hypothetical protein
LVMRGCGKFSGSGRVDTLGFDGELDPLGSGNGD